MKIGKIRINMIEDKSYIDVQNAFANVGESIQAIAIQYIFDLLNISKENVVKVDQCRIKEYSGEKIIFPLRIPLSKECVDNVFPLPDTIIPIFLSLHIHDDIFENRDDLVEYFNMHSPIACRDEKSLDILKKHGIEAYMMGCYTLCLKKRDEVPTSGKPFLVDVSSELNKFIPKKIRDTAVYLSHAVPFQVYPVTHEEDERLERVAQEYIDRYRNEANLVITSRLHVAAPCIAMGIPVILASDNVDFRYAWIDKYLKVYQKDEYQEINWNPKPISIEETKKQILLYIGESIKMRKPAREYLLKLDSYYKNRNRTDYYLGFKNSILRMKEFNNSRKIKYAIWGAGNHAIYAFELMNKYYPEAQLTTVVDKYKEGMIFGRSIIKEWQVSVEMFDFLLITTNPGKEEAICKMKQLFHETAEDRYLLIVSQQKS